jgi:hypothetical protein
MTSPLQQAKKANRKAFSQVDRNASGRNDATEPNQTNPSQANRPER